jgi:hypothetical protein
LLLGLVDQSIDGIWGLWFGGTGDGTQGREGQINRWIRGARPLGGDSAAAACAAGSQRNSSHGEAQYSLFLQTSPITQLNQISGAPFVVWTRIGEFYLAVALRSIPKCDSIDYFLCFQEIAGRRTALPLGNSMSAGQPGNKGTEGVKLRYNSP